MGLEQGRVAELPENFADYPLSINERRDGLAATWTPREALINLLRQIDRGEVDPIGLLVLVNERPTVDTPGTVRLSMRNCTANLHEALGILENAKMQLWYGNGDDD